MDHDVADMPVVALDRDLVAVDEDEYTFDRVAALVVGADAHGGTERRVLVES